MKQGEGHTCNFRYSNSNGGGKGVCVSEWDTCLWGAGWGWCCWCGWVPAVAFIVFLSCYLRDRRDAIRAKGFGNRGD